MADLLQCPDCGSSLPTGATDGLCPRCLMGAGLADSDGNAADVATPSQRAPFVPPTPQDLAPHFAEFELLGLIGHGGMGAVYKARQIKLDRLVALKVVRPESADDPAFAERFTREARTLARLNHSGIVAVHDFGEIETDPGSRLYFFVMEFVDGTTLRDLMYRVSITPPEAMGILQRVCEALEYAHEEGIVHRDIKPENILIDERGRVKIADFGLAKLAQPSAQDYTLTGTHQVMGTPLYMAPEQMQGARLVDHRADIYSLGVVCYEMLTGSVPMGQFEPPSRKAAVDPRLDVVVSRAMAQDPDQRFQHAGEMIATLATISSLQADPSFMQQSHWPGPSTILERGVQRVVAGAQPGRVARFVGHPALPGILAMLLGLFGVFTVCVSWGSRSGRDIHAWDTSAGSLAGVSFFVVTLVMFAAGTTRRAPAWRPWAMLASGAVILACIAMHNRDITAMASVHDDMMMYLAVGAAATMMFVGAWDLRSRIAGRYDDPSAPRQPKKKKKPAIGETAHYGFAIPPHENLGMTVVSHFSMLGYRVVEQRPREWVFERGSRSGGWANDIRKHLTTLTVRSGPRPDSGHWVSCTWAVHNYGAWVGAGDVSKLESEGEQLQLLLPQVTPGTSSGVAQT